MVQRVLIGEAHGAVRLMHGFGNNAGRLPHPRLGGGDLQFEPWASKGVDGGVSRPAGRSRLRRGNRQHVLNGLKLGERAAKLLPLLNIADAHLQNPLQGAGGKRNAGKRHESKGRLPASQRARGLHLNLIPGLAGQVGSRRHPAGRSHQQFAVRRQADDALGGAAPRRVAHQPDRLRGGRRARRPAACGHLRRLPKAEDVEAVAPLRGPAVHQQGFRQRQGDGEAPGHPQHPKGVAELHAAVRKRHEVEAVVAERAPQPGGKLAGLGGVQVRLGAGVLKDARRRVEQHFAHHRSPRPRAMTPRRISRAPPRKVKEGESSRVSA